MISSPAGTTTALGMSNLPRIFGLFHHDFPVCSYICQHSTETARRPVKSAAEATGGGGQLVPTAVFAPASKAKPTPRYRGTEDSGLRAGQPETKVVSAVPPRGIIAGDRPPKEAERVFWCTEFPLIVLVRFRLALSFHFIFSAKHRRHLFTSNLSIRIHIYVWKTSSRGGGS